MGCRTSVVQPLAAVEVGEQDGAESKVGTRGDSAVSKGTTDSGVVMMENREMPALPGAVPAKLPPLTSESVRENEADGVTQAGLLQKESPAQERLKSSEILEELLNEGIIPAEQAQGSNSRAAEAYSIMLDDHEEVRQRPPARLESLRARKTPNKDELDEKMKQVEERRKSREDEIKTRLRSKSARVRCPAPVSTTEEEEDTTLTSVEPLQLPLSPDLPRDPGAHGQGQAAEEEEVKGDGSECKTKMKRSDTEGESRADEEKIAKREKAEEQSEEDELTHVESLQLPLSPDLPRDPRAHGQGPVAEEEKGDSIECKTKMMRSDTEGESRADEGKIAKWEKAEEQSEEEELTHVEVLRADEIVSASRELESDSTFLRPENEIF